jgi:hypothetical protein
VNTAFPAITRGWRALFDQRVGIGTRSGSSAARGLRGAIRRPSLDASPDDVLLRLGASASTRAGATTVVSARGAGLAIVASARADFTTVASGEDAFGITLAADSLLSAIHPTH